MPTADVVCRALMWYAERSSAADLRSAS